MSTISAIEFNILLHSNRFEICVLSLYMAELTYSTSLIRPNTTKKRKISEEQKISIITHDIDRVDLSDEEPIIQSDSNIFTASGKYRNYDANV